MAFTDGVDASCPVCGGDCQGFPNVALPSDYQFLREDQMAEHPKIDEPNDDKGERKPNRARRRSKRAKPGPVEDRMKRDEDR